MKKECGTCVYSYGVFKTYGGNWSSGKCRRHAPVVIASNKYGESDNHSPSVYVEDWCGDWVAASKKELKDRNNG